MYNVKAARIHKTAFSLAFPNVIHPRPRHTSGLRRLAANRRHLPRGKTTTHPLNYYSNLITPVKHTSLRPHTHTQCSPRLLIWPVTLSLQINTSSVHWPTRTSHLLPSQ